MIITVSIFVSVALAVEVRKTENGCNSSYSHPLCDLVRCNVCEHSVAISGSWCRVPYLINSSPNGCQNGMKNFSQVTALSRVVTEITQQSYWTVVMITWARPHTWYFLLVDCKLGFDGLINAGTVFTTDDFNNTSTANLLVADKTES